jgi:hypothetical protein
MVALLVLVGLALADGSQTLFEAHARGATTTFDVAWNDSHGDPQAVSFSLPTHEVAADRDALTRLPRRDLYGAMVVAVERWAKSLAPGTTVTASASEAGFSISARGPKESAKDALEQGNEIAEAAEKKWLVDHDATTLENGSIAFDHAGLAADYAREVRPIAQALRHGTSDGRAYVEKALAFVQSIPYEPRPRRDVDTGYRRPLGVIARNQGDCDSKSVLFLALVRAELPDVPLAFIYVPNHALVGVALPPLGGEAAFVVSGVRYLYAEPVGPGLRELGQPAPADKHAARKGEVRIVPQS